jgi:hypothetical protein
MLIIKIKKKRRLEISKKEETKIPPMKERERQKRIFEGVIRKS